MEQVPAYRIYLKLAAVLLIVTFLAAAGYQYGLSKQKTSPVISSTATPVEVQPKTKEMLSGAACCKSSFSRAGLMSVKIAADSMTR